MSDEYPYASHFFDRHGKQRWRFRRGGRTIALPQAPGHPEFEAAYRAAIEGRKVEKAPVQRMPGAVVPRSLRAAWRILTRDTIEWQRLSDVSRANQTAIAERFLRAEAVPGEPMTFGDLPLERLERRHIKAILARWSDTPHAAAHILRLLRKLTGVGLDEEWITVDPTYRIKYRPEYTGWKAWQPDALAAFEKRWKIGTTPRLVYALALYFGHRRSDLTTLKWTDIEAGGANVVQRKTDKALWIPMHSALKEALEAAERVGDTILVTQYGRPFSPKALGMRMQDWTKAAELAPGHTLHGLRKTLGKRLAEGGATTRQIMAILGHDDIAHAELYTREAEQRRLARDGMKRIDRRVKVVKGGHPK